MASYVNGKPMKEWIAEQQRKNGVLVIHRGTSFDGFCRSEYSNTTVTLGSDHTVRYINADITLRLGDKEYRMTGKEVSFQGGRWYVDGVLREDIPATAGSAMKEANEEMQESLTEQMSQMYGSFMNVNGSVRNTYIHGIGSTTSRVRGSESRQVVMRNGGTVNINRGGKTYTLRGNNIEKRDGQWYVDGRAVNWDEIGGEYPDSESVHIEIHGNVENISTKHGSVTVHGSVGNVSTKYGSVHAEHIGNASTKYGEIHGN